MTAENMNREREVCKLETIIQKLDQQEKNRKIDATVDKFQKIDVQLKQEVATIARIGIVCCLAKCGCLVAVLALCCSTLKYKWALENGYEQRLQGDNVIWVKPEAKPQEKAMGLFIEAAHGAR